MPNAQQHAFQLTPRSPVTCHSTENKGGDEMTNRYTRRRLLTGTVSAAVASLLLSACQPGTQQASPTPQIAATPTPQAPTPTATVTQPPTPTTAPAPATPTPRATKTFRFAYLRLGWAGCEAIDELGLLREKGWNVEWQRIDQISALANAFAAKQADLINMSIVIAAQMYEQGVPLKVYSAAVGTLGAILVRSDLSITSVPELRGRKVGGIPGGTTTQDINAMVRKLYDMDLFNDTEFVQASTPPDAANLLINKNVDALLIWEPTTSRLTLDGYAKILVTQQELWKQVSGRETPQVHVVYLATPSITTEYPDLLQDVIAAQKEVVALWEKMDDKIVQAFSTVTQLPEPVIRTALGRTEPLSGLDKDLQDTILAQLRFNRESGVLLKSDLWLDPEKARSELFWQP